MHFSPYSSGLQLRACFIKVVSTQAIDAYLIWRTMIAIFVFGQIIVWCHCD